MENKIKDIYKLVLSNFALCCILNCFPFTQPLFTTQNHSPPLATPAPLKTKTPPLKKPRKKVRGQGLLFIIMVGDY